jgi:hypothetical protein
MNICYTCRKELDNEICLFENNSYHKYCCGFCKHTSTQPARVQRRPTLITKEETPPPQKINSRTPSPTIPTPKLVKAKSNPRKLSFAQLTSFESSNEFMIICFTCEKPINGQKFLSSKVGSFDCSNCHALNGPKCNLCKKLFDEAEIVYKDDYNNKLCEICIQVENENKKVELKKRNSFTSNKPLLTPKTLFRSKVNAVLAFKNKSKNRLETSIDEDESELRRCYACTSKINIADSNFLTYKGNDYHYNCFRCIKCLKLIAGQIFYEEKDENLGLGLVCTECKTVQKCSLCLKFFSNLERIYSDTDAIEPLNKNNNYNDNKVLYCEICFEKKFGKSCSKCLQHIDFDQSSLVYDGHNFHVDCFICSKCSIKIMPDEQFYKGNNYHQIFCRKCSVLG